MEKIFEKLLELGNDVKLDEKMEYHTSFRIGGPVKYFIIPNTLESFVSTYNFLKKIMEIKVVGKCTNILPSDEKMNIAILSTERIDRIEFKNDIVLCESGVPLKKLCLESMENSLSGFEKAYGIPGSVGGAVYMNAGAYGWVTAENIIYVEAFDGEKIIKLFPSEMEFSYRNSIFRKKKELVILRVAFKVINGDKEKIKIKMNEILKRRYTKQPLEFPSAGSVFKRPREDFYVGTAIENLGLKGYAIGDAQVSEKHAGFIINRGNAKAEEVKKLIEYIKNKIKNVYNVNLETEIEIW
ncbi:UDP-N-acetylmuramate dehydrogenase [Thermosipho atlanticus]|uniref:UDP-N-acetylenolpyruvoylglucosamine reductase n=1 Tax=Thermosipho atlanticus DSM 15807 TaxID=1123380 RepID=A0A1M5R3Y0_9BACT|nr:UDP-N-acetylmuramate dehydrogenase [Thermosipho atlanticus]SHH20911.1 UDP-N-acetylmuramate dehydrogenase [Thermosipho atlanticus DSM 15807]